MSDTVREPDAAAAAAMPNQPIRVGTWPMWVLGLVVFVDAADQNILRGVATLIQKEFHLNDTSLGVLISAFIFVNAIVTIPAGYLADRLNRKRVISLTVVLWSGITALTAACRSFAQLIGVRGLLGFGLGITEPSANSLLTDYYPSQQRGRAFSIQQLLLFVGAGTGLAFGGIIGDAYGWRWAFILIGLPGALTALLVARLHEPKRGHGDRLTVGITTHHDDHEDMRLFEHGFRTFIGDMIRGLRDDIKTNVAIPTLRYVLVGVGVLLFSVTGVAAWLPVYHQRFSGLTIKEATAAVGVMTIVGGIGGTLAGGWVADRFQHRISGGRVAIPAYCLMIGTVIFGITFMPLPAAPDIALQTLGVFVYVLAIPSLRAGLGDAVPADLRGAGFAAFALISALSGAALAPTLLGVLADLTNLRIAFVICLPPIFVGALILLRARAHLDEDMGKVLMAVQRAYQEQQALEAQRAAEEVGDKD